MALLGHGAMSDLSPQSIRTGAERGRGAGVAAMHSEGIHHARKP